MSTLGSTEVVDYAEVEGRAATLRDSLKLGSGSIADIESVLSDAGVAVLVRPLGRGGPDGIYVRRAALSVVLLNGSSYLPRFRFTGAHELGHHQYGTERALDRDVFAAATVEEKRANAFAAAFLVPKSGVAVRVGYKSDISPERVLELANEFGVSYETMVYRLHNCGWLRGGAQRRDELLGARAAIFTDNLRNRRAPRETALPLDFIRRSLRAYAHQQIDIGRLAELLLLDDAEARKLLGQLHLLQEEDT